MKITSIANVVDDEQYFGCECNSLVHTMHFSYFKPLGDEDNVVYCSLFLFQFRSFWQRIPQALRFALGAEMKYGAYDCINIRSFDCPRMIQMLNRLSKDEADINTTECVVADFYGRYNLKFVYGLLGEDGDETMLSQFSTEVHMVAGSPFQNVVKALYYLLFRPYGWTVTAEFDLTDRHAPYIKAMANRHGKAEPQ